MKAKDPHELPYNTGDPLVMHIDLNSCFTTIEQQANRLLRGRPVAVSAYDTPRGFVLAASYEAKAKGIKLGVNVAQARQMCPGIIILTPDPSKYREAHTRFKALLNNYTNDVAPKSIDEFVLNFAGSPSLRSGLSMPQIGQKIKEHIYGEIGEAVTVNVGIAPNRFLAKFAAGFDKPNGLRVIDHTNLRQTYEGMKLTDLPGINTRYEARLRMYGITNPLQFLDAPSKLLQKVIFRSIVGRYWYMRLRGWEADGREFSRKSIGHQYALSKKTDNREELARLLMKLAEKTGRRLRKNNFYATGIHLYLGFEQPPYQANLPASFENMHRFRSWRQGHKMDSRLYSTQEIYMAAKLLLDRAEIPTNVRIMAMTVFGLHDWDPEQLNLFDKDRNVNASKQLSDALDAINNRYGEFVLTPATMMDMKGTILDRIAFGQVRDF